MALRAVFDQTLARIAIIVAYPCRLYLLVAFDHHLLPDIRQPRHRLRSVGRPRANLVVLSEQAGNAGVEADAGDNEKGQCYHRGISAPKAQRLWQGSAGEAIQKSKRPVSRALL
jgi:hypothetical protein